MKKLMTVLLLSGTVWAEGPRPVPPVLFPPGPGAAIAKARCTSCHGGETLVNARLDAITWKQALHKELTERGARLSEQEKSTLLKYLIKNFPTTVAKNPPVKVNLR